MKKTIILQVPFSWTMRIKGILMTVIPLVYGHNMKNGSMFAQLKKFSQVTVIHTKKSKYFWIFTPEKNYQI